MFKLVKILLTFLHLLAQREERKQSEKQKQYRKQQAAKAKVLNEAADAARAKAHALNSQAVEASTAAICGDVNTAKAYEVAVTLRSQLAYIAGK